MTELTLLDDGPVDCPVRLLLAHGAGAAMDSPFLNTFIAMMSALGIATTRFEFEYMAARRLSPSANHRQRLKVLFNITRAL